MILDDFTELTIYQVEKLHNIFVEALEENDDILLDMMKIEKIDMVGIQLLISLVRSAEASQNEVEFTNIKDSVLQQIEISNSHIALGLDK